MKKTFFTLSILLLSKISFSQTTWDEYNYCTKGFKTQIESGLDLTKKGYEITSIGEQKYTYNGFDNFSSAKIFGLKPTGFTRPTALIVVYEKYFDKELYAREYLCIPTEDAPEDMLVKTYQTINGISLYEKQADTSTRLVIILMKVISQFLTSH